MSSKTLLEEVDIPGQSYLREALTSCIDPLKGKTPSGLHFVYNL